MFEEAEPRVQDIKLQRLAQITEYFLCRDLYALAVFVAQLRQRKDALKMCDAEAMFKEVEEFVAEHKQKYFPQCSQDALESAPDWDADIGGLNKVKEVIEEIFGISQKYSIFFQG